MCSADGMPVFALCESLHVRELQGIQMVSVSWQHVSMYLLMNGFISQSGQQATKDTAGEVRANSVPWHRKH